MIKSFIQRTITGLYISSVCFAQVDSIGSLKAGIVQFNQGNYEVAQVELQKAVELNPKSPDVYFYLAEVSFILNETRKSMEYYNKSIELNLRYAKAYKGRGMVKAKFKDFYGAIEDFSKAIDIDNKYSDAYFNRGLSYYNLKDYKEAIADFTKVIEFNPKDYEAYLHRGTAKKFQSGDSKGGCKDWNKASELGYFKIYDTIKKNCK